MTTTVTISDTLAALLEQRRAEEGYASIDAVAAALIAQGLAEDDDEVLDEESVEELRALIAEADQSGPPQAWDAKAVRAEVLRRHAERSRRT